MGKGSENNIIKMKLLIIIFIVSIFVVTGIIVTFAIISVGMSRDGSTIYVIRIYARRS